MSTGDEGFERHFTPPAGPELTAYLEAHQDIEPTRVVLLNHIPPLIGGLKSNKFIIQDQEASPDTPPDPDARIDLKKTVVASSALSAFSNFFDRAETQADAQYEAALFETHQVLAEASGRGVAIDTLFVPDTVNSTASDYFRRLTRLAQDTGVSVVVRIVDYEDDYAYQSFKRFEPIRAASAADYWSKRADELASQTKSLIHLGNYAVYTMGGAYTFDDPPTVDTLDAINLPTLRPPLVFTTFEQLQKDYPNSPISEPAVWETHKHNYTLVGDQDEYMRVEHEYNRERDDLRANMYRIARMSTDELRKSLLGGGLHQDKLSIIRELAGGSDDNNAPRARIVLAKLGDKASAQMILQEIQDKTGGWGSESLTTAPLGIHLRYDEQLFNSVVDEVRSTIAEDPGSSHRLLNLLGALYHSHDPRVGELMAGYLTIPTRNAEAYARTVLHAAARWMPEYTMALAMMHPSEQRDRTLDAIEVRTAAFIDAHNHGRLEGIRQHMMFGPDSLLPLLFWFSNPAHRPILARAVRRQFKAGGSILTDPAFEQTYLLYRARYGDLPEISQHIRS